MLDTYEDERRHVALVNSQQSVKNGRKIFSFLKTLGATVEDMEEARANLLQTINDPMQANVIAEHIESQREHFDNVSIAEVSVSQESTNNDGLARTTYWIRVRRIFGAKARLTLYPKVHPWRTSATCLD